MTGREEEGNRPTLEPATLIKQFSSLNYVTYFCHVIIMNSRHDRTQEDKFFVYFEYSQIGLIA